MKINLFDLNSGVYRAQSSARGLLTSRVPAAGVTFLTLCICAATASAAPWVKVAVWHMNETSGSTMRDSVGVSGAKPNGRNPGKLHSIRLGRVGFTGGAYGFNGTSSYVDVPHSSSLAIGTKSFRVTVHVRTSVPGNSSSGDDLIKKGYYETSPGLFKMEFYPSGKVSCGFKGPKGYTGDIFSTSSVVTQPPAYRTVRCELDQVAKQARLSVNGVVQATKSADVGSISSTNPVLIGAYPGSGYYEGVLDEVVIETRSP